MILSLHDLISLTPFRRLDRAIDHTYGDEEFEGVLVQPNWHRGLDQKSQRPTKCHREFILDVVGHNWQPRAGGYV